MCLDRWTLIYLLGKKKLLNAFTQRICRLPQDEFIVLWKGIRGFLWSNLYNLLARLMNVWPLPHVLIIHLGGNDLCKVRTLDLIFQIKSDVQRFQLVSLNSIVIFSEIIPRMCWFSSGQCRVMKKT